jgi:hypothetical protein
VSPKIEVDELMVIYGHDSRVTISLKWRKLERKIIIWVPWSKTVFYALEDVQRNTDHVDVA